LHLDPSRRPFEWLVSGIRHARAGGCAVGQKVEPSPVGFR
jgi:hypothetical protein